MWVILDDHSAFSLEGAREIKVSGEGDDLTLTVSFQDGGGSRTLKTRVSHAEAAHFLSALASGKPLDLREPVEPLVD